MITGNVSKKNRVFVGSSTESQSIANALQVRLESVPPYDVHVTTWTQGVFQASKTLIESLEAQLDRYDFAVLVCAADDLVISRGVRKATLRDNVLFELGLFMGRMGRERVYLLVPSGDHSIKLPTDLNGVVYLTYDPERLKDDLDGCVGASAHQLRTRFASVGARKPIEDDASLWKDTYGLTEFRSSFLGYSYDAIIKDRKDLLIIVNDGRSWIDTHRELLAKRIANSKQQTRAVLLHPHSSFIDTLVTKNRKSKVVQIGDIKRSYEALEDARKTGSRLDIRGHYLFNPCSLYLTEREAILSPYLFLERGSLPLFVFAKEAKEPFYQHIWDDAQRMFNTSVPLTLDDFNI